MNATRIDETDDPELPQFDPCPTGPADAGALWGINAEMKAELDELLGEETRLEVDHAGYAAGDIPLPVSVWQGDDIIGAGICISDALDDALKQAREWAEAK